MKSDQDQRGGATPYRTSTRGLPPPLVTTQFIVQDDGEGHVSIGKKAFFFG